MQVHPSGTRIAGRYEVAGRPLIGGMGIVYLCLDHEEQRPVALKTFKPEFLSDRAARERFLEEGNTWVRLGKHPHIVRCYRVFQDSPRPEVYLALELVAKEEDRRDASLRSWLTTGHPLPVDQALLITLQIVRGLRHAVATIPGFVHRDLKPENVLVGADRLSGSAIHRVRVTDFGLVKGLRAEQVSQMQGKIERIGRPGQLTRAGSVLGTPHYMAPEQWMSADVDVRADIYALGCILGEMLAGRLAVPGRSLSELSHGHRSGQALATIDNVSSVLQDLLTGCLAVEPGRRFRNWMDVETTLATAYAQVAGRPVPEAATFDALSRTEHTTMSWSQIAIGHSYLNLGNAQAAVRYFSEACREGKKQADPQLEVGGLQSLSLARTRLGEIQEAIDCLYQAQSLVQAQRAAKPNLWDWEVGFLEKKASILSDLGNAYLDLGDTHRAITHLQEALTIHSQIDDWSSTSLDLGHLGRVYATQGQMRKAAECFEQALANLNGMEDMRDKGTVLSNLGGAFLQLNQPERAVEVLEQAEAIHEEIGDSSARGTDLDNLGSALLQLRHFDLAINRFKQAITLRRQVADRHGEGNSLANLGLTFLSSGDARQAIVYLKKALNIQREIGDHRGEGADLINLGNAYAQLNDPLRTTGYFEQALNIFRNVGDRRSEAIACGNLVRAYAQAGQVDRAIDYLKQALAICEEIGDAQGTAVNSLNLALLCIGQGDLRGALRPAKEAARLFARLGNTTYAQRAQQLVADLETQGK